MPADPVVGHARVLVDARVEALSRVFDYAIPERLAPSMNVGCRVRVPLGHRTLPGIVVALDTDAAFDGDIRPVASVVSPVPVLQPQIATLCQRVADHYAGSLADVLRFALPPRVARLEQGWRPAPGAPPPSGKPATRTAWVCPSAVDWAAELVDRAAARVPDGQGALIVLPDGRDVERVAAMARQRGLPGVAVLQADAGPNARYASFLDVLAGRARVVIGTRSAAFAPVRNLGLAMIWDDSSDTYAEQRAPYHHAREVLAFRSHLESCGFVIAGHARSCEAQRWVESGWLSEGTDREVLRVQRPTVRTVGDPRSPFDAVRRFPDAAVRALREGLRSGPVLVAVSRTGHVPVTACQECREIAECRHCGGPLGIERDGQVRCRRCGLEAAFTCPTCGGHALRAVRVGATRTAEEVGRLFPQTRVIISSGDARTVEVSADPAVVVATPGAEPRAAEGFSAAYLPDAELDLWRPELRARELALARWLSVCSQVRPKSPIVVHADEADETVQAFVRWDPVGFASRELQRRADVALPPAKQILQVDGADDAVADLLAVMPGSTVVMGPRELDGPHRVRLLLRAEDFATLRDFVRRYVDEHPRRGDDTWRLHVDPFDVE